MKLKTIFTSIMGFLFLFFPWSSRFILPNTYMNILEYEIFHFLSSLPMLLTNESVMSYNATQRLICYLNPTWTSMWNARMLLLWFLLFLFKIALFNSSWWRICIRRETLLSCDWVRSILSMMFGLVWQALLL